MCDMLRFRLMFKNAAGGCFSLQNVHWPAVWSLTPQSCSLLTQIPSSSPQLPGPRVPSIGCIFQVRFSVQACKAGYTHESRQIQLKEEPCGSPLF